ncbi:macrophage mannose receptor 1-like isoform X1 [Hoplias malabaricus]|uniref:macrophage mannose receptor 1-like isoform X1 n=1 Tax=Hoplias malabaricus TaxID=27720 RepID=UPI0034621B27
MPRGEQNQHQDMALKSVSFMFLFSAVCGASLYPPYKYHFVNENKSWTKAQSYCRQKYTDLATVSNMEEMKNLNTTLKDKTTSSVWIGLNRGNTGRWLWSLGDSDLYRNWAVVEPNNKFGQEYCVEMYRRDGTWNDNTCDNVFSFLCYDDKLVLVNMTLTWWGALRYCRENHRDLVSVHSEEVQSWVMKVAQKASTDHVWLGLRHTCRQGFWFWVSGFAICYQNWALGNGTGGEDCGSGERSGAVESSGAQQWVSLPETKTLNFICTNY